MAMLCCLVILRLAADRFFYLFAENRALVFKSQPAIDLSPDRTNTAGNLAGKSRMSAQAAGRRLILVCAAAKAGSVTNHGRTNPSIAGLASRCAG
jgi:hypothetical protein